MCDKNERCPICANPITREMFRAIVRGKYQAVYRLCDQCRFLFVEAPRWLSEAYNEPINIYDTGIMARNLAFSRMTAVVIYFLFEKKGRFLDYGGGYGIFTRLMRDIGFDFYWYDAYATNLVARGFEPVEATSNYGLLTCFEVLEHLVDPLKEIERMFHFSDNILFSTTLLPVDIPKPGRWSYYGFEHGQHICFYSLKTLNFIAKRFNSNIYSDGSNMHLFTKLSLSPSLFKLSLKLSRFGLASYVRVRMKSKTEEDFNLITKKISYENTL